MVFQKKADPDSFYTAYRMTPDTFDELLVLLGPHLVKETTTFRDPVIVPACLCIILRNVACYRFDYLGSEYKRIFSGTVVLIFSFIIF